MRRIVSILLAAPLLCLTPWSPRAEASVIGPSDFLVTQLELTGGSADFHRRFSRKLDRLFDQHGLLVMNEFQPGPDIVSPITAHRRTFSLFTSGVQGNPAPTATVNGDTITVDLSSLFFAVSKGDRLYARNIGGMATGTFDPETLEFSLSWEYLFGNRHRGGPAEFSLQGRVITGDNTTPVPLVTTALFFATGLAMLIGVWRQRGMGRMGKAIPAA